ncbi:MAG: tRNA (N6-isopentenyl adenosine(37)-C2)-methylthiotransferase MiaB [Lachnospiraceae bacterium]|nr:tRNA (N6-isopentenyl adenosine(37)-C2)-methylthiotransferase MiaB [Lachnospiraceae bacterium]
MYDNTEILNEIKKYTSVQDAPLNEPERQYFFMAKLKEVVDKRSEEKGKRLTACVVTFGCQMNARDSEKISGILKVCGYELTEDERADLVLYNTCTVRENANLKVYGRLGRLKNYKEKNPDMITVLCGCMMQEEGVREKIKKSFHNVDIVFGTFNIYMFAELLYMKLIDPDKNATQIMAVKKDYEAIVEELPKDRKYPFKSGVNIMFGCNNFCSYCIVPYVRGRERSRASKDIIEEVKTLAKDGVKEVMLLGQNVNSYGKGLEEDINFADLLRMVNDIDGIERIRFMSSHPKDLSDELIEAMKDCDKVCPQLHLAMQSGSSRLLEKMNRHYTKEDFINLVEKLRKAVPDISLSTDIIVGFPGETEEDFLETMDVIEKVRFNSVFTFQYSKRTGTPAAVMENQVEPSVVKDRFDRLLKLVQSISDENTKDQVGFTEKVLVEEKDDKLPGYLTGRTDKNYLVHFEGCDNLIGNIVDVKIIESKGFYYIGELV